MFFFFSSRRRHTRSVSGIPAEPLFRSSQRESVKNDKPTISMSLSHCIHQTLNSKASTRFHSGGFAIQDRKSGSAGMPRPISYAVFCLKKTKQRRQAVFAAHLSYTNRMLQPKPH